ncbi:cation-transporting P-type ATPase [Streptomyces sp. NBC_00846]|uniref:P-type ATPase n=1 Tax=Streptomyces sp. NBC_00846 TaxID=2975849 RepID=UPI00386CCCC1|nr:cation-transporting P-type ATPase [Streptomyces sp. NBC_00846]
MGDGRRGLDPEEAAELLLRDLRSSRAGLTSVEAGRRLLQYGRNELRRRGGRRWPRELARQFTHPLALLLWLAAALLAAVGSNVVAAAVVLIIFLNAAFAFIQEVHAEHAVEALAAYIPQRAKAHRDGVPREIEATELVPGDIIVIEAGDRIAADIRLLKGAIEIDMSALTGESVTTLRSASILDVDVPVLTAHDLVFSGTSCTGGEAHGVVFATGMSTELGRIAALSERVKQEPSTLEIFNFGHCVADASACRGRARVWSSARSSPLPGRNAVARRCEVREARAQIVEVIGGEAAAGVGQLQVW